jgi:peptidoglycan/LPS O-acetylase OafA/YrhL
MSRLSSIIKQNNRVDSLDFLRSIATILVLLTHFELFDFHGISVDIFFVLSGFLIIKSVSKHYHKNLIKEFVIKRFFRIIPTYYIFLILAYVLSSLILPEKLIHNIPIVSEWKQYFLFFRNYGGLPNRWSFEHLWSLCVEEHFYITIVLLLIIYKNKFSNNLRNICYLVLFIGIMLKVQAMFTLIAEYPTYTHNRIDSFAWGGLVYLWINEKKLQKLSLTKTMGIIILLLLFLAFIIIKDLSVHNLFLRTLSPLIFSIIILITYPIKVPLSSVFRFISYISYNVYLWHYIFVIPISHYLGKSFSAFIVYVFLTTAFAFLFTFTIDESSHSIRNKLLRRLKKTPNT